MLKLNSRQTARYTDEISSPKMYTAPLDEPLTERNIVVFSLHPQNGDYTSKRAAADF